MRYLFASLLLCMIGVPAAAVLYAREVLPPPQAEPTPLKIMLDAPPQDAPKERAAPDAAKDPSVQYPASASATTKQLSRAGHDITPLPREKVAELAKKLSPEAYRITQNAGTEPAFCGTLLDNKKEGTYCCVVCGLPLFASKNKFNSGTGWPSFFAPFDVAHVAAKEDNSHGMQRVEILCARCNAHLGHVFDDGPKPTGLRFCLNGAALTFTEKGTDLPAESQPVPTATAYFGGGCFWGVEHYFQQAPGVVNAISGYMQGSLENPTYKDVTDQDKLPAFRRSADFKPHVEAVKVVYDPTVISYRQLLEGFFQMIDPTTLNRQGPDFGSQYRSGLYTVDPAQEAAARAFVAELSVRNLFGAKKIVTEIETAQKFYPAEAYHQDYLEMNPTRGCALSKPWWVTKTAPAEPWPAAAPAVPAAAPTAPAAAPTAPAAATGAN
jgi:peptide methionine sulfoxide reductase msrA/msrB